MDPFGVGSAELVAGSFTPFLEGVCKSCQGQSCHAFFKSWYEGYKDQVSPTTYESYGYTLKTLNRAFGSKPLRSIRAADVEAFLRDLTKDGTHQSQASKCRGMMFQQKGLLHSGRSPEIIQWLAARQDRRQHQAAATHGHALPGAACA